MPAIARPKRPVEASESGPGDSVRKFISKAHSGHLEASETVTEKAAPLIVKTPDAYPWEAEDIDQDGKADFLLRMKLPMKLKVNYVLDRIPGRLSMQKYVLSLIEADIEAKLKELQG